MAIVIVHDQPLALAKLRNLLAGTFERCVAVAGKAWQDALSDACADQIVERARRVRPGGDVMSRLCIQPACRGRGRILRRDRHPILAAGRRVIARAERRIGDRDRAARSEVGARRGAVAHTDLDLAMGDVEACLRGLEGDPEPVVGRPQAREIGGEEVGHPGSGHSRTTDRSPPTASQSSIGRAPASMASALASSVRPSSVSS